MQNDLISRKSLIERLAYYHAHSYGMAEYAYGVATEEVVKAPAIDAVPVVHARWELVGADKRGRCGVFNCTACNRCRPTKSDYCPNCGAKMDLKKVEHEG